MSNTFSRFMNKFLFTGTCAALAYGAKLFYDHNNDLVHEFISKKILRESHYKFVGFETQQDYDMFKSGNNNMQEQIVQKLYEQYLESKKNKEDKVEIISEHNVKAEDSYEKEILKPDLKIILNAGHLKGHSEGTNYQGIEETQATLDLVKIVAEKLQGSGYQVKKIKKDTGEIEDWVQDRVEHFYGMPLIPGGKLTRSKLIKHIENLTEENIDDLVEKSLEHNKGSKFYEAVRQLRIAYMQSMRANETFGEAGNVYLEFHFDSVNGKTNAYVIRPTQIPEIDEWREVSRLLGGFIVDNIPNGDLELYYNRNSSRFSGMNHGEDFLTIKTFQYIDQQVSKAYVSEKSDGHLALLIEVASIRDVALMYRAGKATEYFGIVADSIVQALGSFTAFVNDRITKK